MNMKYPIRKVNVYCRINEINTYIYCYCRYNVVISVGNCPNLLSKFQLCRLVKGDKISNDHKLCPKTFSNTGCRQKMKW